MNPRTVKLSATALIFAVALITVACGGSGSGSQDSVSQSGGSSSVSESLDGTTTETAGGSTGGETTSGMSGMSDMDSTEGMDMGSEEMARKMLTENGGYSDENFIDLMVPHHRSAIEEAQVALKNAEHEKLSNLAKGIIADQRLEIQRMRGIKQEEYGTREVPQRMSSEKMGMMEDPQALAEEKPFDRAFMNNMIPHHRSAIAMAEVALEESENAEIRSLARSIVQSQQSEIEQMRGWLKEWY